MDVDLGKCYFAKVDQKLACNGIPTKSRTTRRKNDEVAMQGTMIRNNIVASNGMIMLYVNLHRLPK